MEVEEELRLFKEQYKQNLDFFFFLYNLTLSSREEENNAPVEGPIPLEPDEKLEGYKRDESKIRQL
jgi:hypothetical protein